MQVLKWDFQNEKNNVFVERWRANCGIVYFEGKLNSPNGRFRLLQKHEICSFCRTECNRWVWNRDFFRFRRNATRFRILTPWLAIKVIWGAHELRVDTVREKYLNCSNRQLTCVKWMRCIQISYLFAIFSQLLDDLVFEAHILVLFLQLFLQWYVFALQFNNFVVSDRYFLHQNPWVHIALRKKIDQKMIV